MKDHVVVVFGMIAFFNADFVAKTLSITFSDL